MIASFDMPESERHLYFLLNNTIHLCSPLSGSGYKIAGLYSIHHSGKCRYVGQSQNLPSRLANHLSGHYSRADEIRVYFICEDGFNDFYERPKEARKSILLSNEMKLIQLLRPIDNIVSDYDASIGDDQLFDFLVGKNYGCEDLILFLSNKSITVTDDIYTSMAKIDVRAVGGHKKHISRKKGVA